MSPLQSSADGQPRRRVFVRVAIAVVALVFACFLAWTALAGGTQPYETYDEAVATDGPVAQFRFNDASGSKTIADSAGSYTATNDEIVLGGEGPFGGSKSGSFGGEAYASLPSSPLASAGAFTMEGWVDWTGGSSYEQPIFDFGSSTTNYMFLTPASSLSSHKMLFEIRTSASSDVQVTAPKLASKKWEYLAVTETSSGTLTLYVNGEQVGQTTGATLFPSSLGGVGDDYLGKSQVASAPLFNGGMSNVAFYNKALSGERIEAHYNAGEYPVNTEAPTISGTVRDGSVLSAKADTWTGLTPISYAYQWMLCNSAGEGCTSIPSATETKYTLGHEDVGQTLRVAVTGTNSAGGSTATSAQTTVIAPLGPSNTALPAISGAAEQGQLLSVSNGTWSGTPPLSYSYKWETCNSAGEKCKAITGATSSSYRVLGSQIGDTLRGIVTAENAAGSKSATSEPTVVITTGPPVNAELPAVSGEAKEGKTLSTSTGTWAGTEPFSYTYQWQMCNSAGESCANISGATSSSYSLGQSDVGGALRVIVTAKNSVGSTAATSQPSPIVVGPPVNTSAPVISGTARDGQTLSASTGVWSGYPAPSYAYQWQSCNSTGGGCTNISGATGSTYVLGHGDVGTTLRVVVKATNSAGSASATSEATAVVAALAPSNTVLPAISGAAEDGKTLSASTGEWEGTPTLGYTYRWQSCDGLGVDCTNIAGATSSTYTLGHSDVGTTVQVVVTATNSAGMASATSPVSAVVVASPPTNTAAPAITGTARDGQTFTASAGSWTGTSPLSYAYQWERCNNSGESCANVTGATSPTYQLGPEDVGSTLRVLVTASNVAGSASASSAASAVVSALAPSNTAAPAITGAAQDGQTLTASTGTWNGTPPLTYTDQWESCNISGEECANISGATSPTYALGHGDVGTTLRVVVTASNAAGSASVTSEASGMVAALAPSNIEAPAITGTANDGETLTASTGSWYGTPPITYSYQWESCDSLGEGCLDVSGATSSTYTLGAGDVGMTLRVIVTATNAGGSASASSEASATVASSQPQSLIYTSTFGSEGSGDGQFYSPVDVAIDSAGNLWVADRGNDRVEEFSTEGQYLGQFGSDGSGDGQLDEPDALAADSSGHLWVLDAGNNRVEEFNENGEYMSQFALETPQNDQGAPEGIAVDAHGDIWISDTYSHRVDVFTQTGEFVRTVGEEGTEPGQLMAPEGIAIGPHGDVWVADGDNNRVEVFNEAGEYIRQFGSEGAGAGQFSSPFGIAVDSKGHVFVSDLGNDRVQEFNEQGEFLQQFGSSGSGAGELNLGVQTGLAVDSNDDIWVADTNNDRVEEWSLGVPVTPSNVTLPSISGEPAVYVTLTANHGSWSGTPPFAYTYQWERCSDSGTACEDISDANGENYQPVASDVGHTLAVAVTAGNTAGSATASSAASSVITGSPCVNTWTGAAGDGLWQTAGNWSSGSVPGSGDEVCIPTDATANITEGSQTVGRVNGKGSLVISGGSLELSDASQPSKLGSLSLSEGTLTGSGTLDLASSFTLGGNSTMSGSGAIVIGPEANGLIDASTGCEPMTLSQRTLVNEGRLSYAWGTLMMSDGAVLENGGTLEYNTQSSCYEPQVREAEESSNPPAIINTGTFERTDEGTGGIGVNFNNDGTVEAQQGRLEFSDGGIPEEVAMGSWTVQDGGSIDLTGGTFDIGEEVDLSHVEVAGATIERTSASGPGGYLNAQPYASRTVTISGRGHDLASARIELTPAGTNEWQPLCGPLTPNLINEFECQWNTASGSYPDGSYQLRAQLANSSTPPDTAVTATVTVLVDNTPPTGSVSAPSRLEGDQAVSGTANDAVSGVASWQLQIAHEGSDEWANACPAQTSPTSGSAYECTIDTFSYENGHYDLRAVVTNKAGNTFTTTPELTTVENESPTNITPPSISGMAQRGHTLTATAGLWSGSHPLTYTYQWQKCNDTEENCANISGATSAQYRIGAGDMGSTLRVVVTATNSLGSISTTSQATAAVAGPTCTEVWTGEAGDSSWSTPGDWSTGQVPNASDVVCIGAGTTVEVSSGSSVAGQLEDEGNLVLSGGSLELTDATQLSSVGSLTMSNATLTGAGSLLISGSFSFGAHGTMSGSGETIIGAGVSGVIEAASGCEPMRLSERKLINEGTLTFAWGTLLMSNGAQLENEGTFEDNTEASCDGTQIQASGGANPSLLNTGVFRKTVGSGTSTVAVGFTNQGTVEAQTGTLDFSSGGVPGEVAYGAWTIQGEGSIVFSAGAFWISEGVSLSMVRNTGATVELIADTGPPVSLIAPIISGEPRVGQALNATAGQWKGARPLDYAYQWERCEITGDNCTEISDATSSTYLLTGEDYHSVMRVTVTVTNSEGSMSKASKVTGTVIFPPRNTSPPTISGTAQAGQTLNASAGSWEGGSSISSYAYQWQRCSEEEETSGGGGGGPDDAFAHDFATPLIATAGERKCVSISGATGATYTPQNSDVEDTIRVVVTAMDEDGETSAISAESEAVLPAQPPENTRLPSVSGTAQEGQTFEASIGAWQSPGTISYSYQWQRCNAGGEACANIESATKSTYVPGIPDLSNTLRVTITATDREGSASATSGPSAVIAQAPPPTLSEAATISGAPKDGQTLTASTGSWETPFPLSYTYQWQRCSGAGEETCSDIEGATGANYTLSSADPTDSYLRVVVTATNIYEASSSSTSAARFLPHAARITEYSYDANGNLQSRTDGNDQTTTYTYGPGNEQTKVTEPDGTTTETGYNVDGQVISQTDGDKHTTKYTRNVLGQVTEVTDPLGRKTTKEYEPAGDLTSVTDPEGRTTNYSYDAANQLTEVSYSDGKTPAVKYEYDPDGNRIKMTDGTGTTTSNYNQLDELTETTNGHGYTVGYEYNLTGQQTKVTYPGNKPVERGYDKDGRLASVKDWLGNETIFAYDPDSNLVATTFPESTGETDRYAYNDADQMTETSFDKGSETLASLSYGRNEEGQVASTVSTGLTGEDTTNYAYNENNQITKSGSTAYEYDAAGNLTSTAGSTYVYDEADQLEHSSNASYTYNEVGERTKTTPATGPATSYGYDQAGNLTTVERPEEGTTPKIEDNYTYNGEGLRTSETISGTTGYLTWDTAEPELPLILSNATDSFVYGPGRLPIEQINNTTGTVQYLHHDQQGSTRLITGSTGAVEGKCSYSAYGTPTCEGSATTPLEYDAQYTSSDTGLIYMRARNYDPVTGQFLSVDPAVSITQEPYSYAGDNPVNEQDRTGLEEETVYCAPWGCVSVPGGSGGGPGQPLAESVEKNWHEFEGGAESIWNEITGGGGSSLPKREGRDEKTHGEIPSHPPSGATTEELEEALEDLEHSMPIREQELREKGEEKEHRRQLEEERKLRRQIEKRLGCES